MGDESSPRAELRPPQRWSGRDDGPGPEHARWHSVIRPWSPDRPAAGAAVILGFASDEGVRRNGGRIGAAAGPPALRAALASPCAPGPELRDGGDVLVGEDLEGGQVLLAEQVAAVLRTGALPVVLGGGHEVAFGSYLGWSATSDPGPASERWGILNVDAHFDLREAPAYVRHAVPPGGPRRGGGGTGFQYAVVRISRANNTRALLDTAAALAVPFLDDDAASRPSATAAFVGWLGAWTGST